MNRVEALKILGIKEPASEEEIRAAHKKKVRSNHPDRFANDPARAYQAEEATKKINEARDVLLGKGVRPSGQAASYGEHPFASNPFAGQQSGSGYTTYTWSSTSANPTDSAPFDAFFQTKIKTPQERLDEAKIAL